MIFSITKKNWMDISGSTTLVGFEYTYDLFGNRLTDNHLHSSIESETYYYDTAQRFTKYERGTIGGSPIYYQSYTLDDLANWTTFNNNGATESRSHNSVNELTIRGATNLTYDANGNLTNDGNQKYVWDELNRLIQVKDSGNNLIVDYYYNADNLRVEKHYAGGAKEQFYYDGALVIEETDGSQNLVREYVNGGQYIDEVILVANTIGASVVYNYYMTDLRYSVYGFIDSSGAVVERAKYDGYGKRTLLDSSFNAITTPLVVQSYGYTGIRHDNESQLQYYRARYFDNMLGRFISMDPIGYNDGMNLYQGYFVNGGVDPSGKAHKIIKSVYAAIDLSYIKGFKFKASVAASYVCCEKGPGSLKKNYRKNRAIAELKELTLSGGEGIETRHFQKKTQKSIIGLINSTVGKAIADYFNTEFEANSLVSEFKLAAEGSLYAKYDGCRESFKIKSTLKVSPEGSGALTFGGISHGIDTRFWLKLSAKGKIKFAGKFESRKFSVGGGEGATSIEGEVFVGSGYATEIWVAFGYPQYAFGNVTEGSLKGSFLATKTYYSSKFDEFVYYPVYTVPF